MLSYSMDWAEEIYKYGIPESDFVSTPLTFWLV